MNKDQLTGGKPVQQDSTPTEPKSREKTPRRIFLIPYPKVIFLYPTFIVATIAAFAVGYQSSLSSVLGLIKVSPPPDSVAVLSTIVFLYVLGVNLIVLAFDFPRATSLALLFFIVAVALGLTLAFTLHPDWLPSVVGVIKAIRPQADATFFACVAVILGVIFVGVFIAVRFDYWEVQQNELLHHSGILSDLNRFPASQLQINKEINDIFEYMLMGSGRLTLQASGERRAIVLDNVPFISRKERQITQMLGALRVNVAGQDDHLRS